MDVPIIQMILANQREPCMEQSDGDKKSYAIIKENGLKRSIGKVKVSFQ